MFDGKYPPSLEGVEILTDAILGHLVEWTHYKYGSDVDYPPSALGVPPSLLRSGTREIDCSSFTWAILSSVYPDTGWNLETYKKWQMWARHDLWGPLTMAEEMGIGTNDSSDGWHLFQIWRKPWESGHSFLALCLGDNMLVLEASNASREPARHSGVVWKNIGPATAPLPSMWSGLKAELLHQTTFASLRLRNP